MNYPLLGIGALLAAAFAAAPAMAETMPEAMASALRTSPSLASARAQVAAVRETLPIAWAEALPQISASGAANQIERSERSFASLVRESPDYWIASVNTSTLLFGSGRVLASTRQARAQIASAVAAYQDVAQNLLLEVARAYGGVSLARATKTAQEQALDNLEQQVRYVAANVREGFLTQTDLAQARARVELSRAELAQSRLQLVQASEAYTRLVGHPPAELDAAPEIGELPGDLTAAVDIAAAEHPSIRSAMSALEASNAAVSVAAAAGRPRVSIDTTHSFFETMSQENAREAGEDSVAVRLSIPLFSGGAISARTRQQRASRTAAHFDLADTQSQVRERATVAWFGLHAARATLDASAVRLEATELAQRGIQREQQAGLRSTIDVLNQEQELLSARVGRASAERDYLVAQREMAASIGRLAVLTFAEAEHVERAANVEAPRPPRLPARRRALSNADSPPAEPTPQPDAPPAPQASATQAQQRDVLLLVQAEIPRTRQAEAPRSPRTDAQRSPQLPVRRRIVSR